MTIEFAKDHLNMLLSFYPRVDGAIAVLVGVEVAMLGYLAPQVPASNAWRGLEIVAVMSLVVAVASLAFSFVTLYRAAFPQLEGGDRSLIYSRAIAKRAKSEFESEYRAATEADVLSDMISQIWRNSEILTNKYDRLKMAFVWLGVALPCWLIALSSL